MWSIFIEMATDIANYHIRHEMLTLLQDTLPELQIILQKFQSFSKNSKF